MFLMVFFVTIFDYFGHFFSALKKEENKSFSCVFVPKDPKTTGEGKEMLINQSRLFSHQECWVDQPDLPGKAWQSETTAEVTVDN